MDTKEINIEVKCLAKKTIDEVRKILVEQSFIEYPEFHQTDSYFETSKPGSRLKLRQTLSAAEHTCELIGYRRENQSEARESEFYRAMIASDQFEKAKGALSSTMNPRVSVTKKRVRFQSAHCLINYDHIDQVGNFIEIEVFVKHLTKDAAMQLMSDLRSQLGMRDETIIPWSYEQIIPMYAAARAHQHELEAVSNPGMLYLIDGPSGSGKTTMIEKLQTGKLGSHLIFPKRYSTRPPRGIEDTEYNFVSISEFSDMRNNGEFIDSKDFLFGMSYGLAWRDILPHLKNGQSVLAPMNWGNSAQVKNLFPQARIIQITASREDLLARLERRGIHSTGHIEERLGNAARFASSADYADLTVENRDGRLEHSISEIENFIQTLSRIEV